MTLWENAERGRMEGRMEGREEERSYVAGAPSPMPASRTDKCSVMHGSNFKGKVLGGRKKLVGCPIVRWSPI